MSTLTDPLQVACPTCKAPAGAPCDKRGNLAKGGPHHLTRVDRWTRIADKPSPEAEEMQRAINEMVARQVRARNDLIERVLLHSLTGTCGVLVTDDPNSGDVTAVVDERIPYATVAYVPAQRVFDEIDPSLLEPAPVENLHMLLRHLAKRLAEVDGGDAPPRPRHRERQGWFADVCSDPDETDPIIKESWQPCLQVGGAIHSFDVWFKSRKDCEAYIRDEILGQGEL